MLQQPELLKVTVADIDGVTEEPPAPVNILRGKTFNPELSTLLNKIYSHEKVADAETPGVSKVTGMDPMTKFSLLQQCDDLLYTHKHQAEAATVDSGFNPFSLDINVYDDIDDLNDYIKAGMSQCGFSRFIIMKYKFSDAAFRTELNMIDAALTSDMFLGTKDQLFRLISENSSGCIVRRETVASDPFLRKKLGQVFFMNDNPEMIYFVRLYNLCESGQDSIRFKENISSFEEYLSPILAVIPDKKPEYCDNAFFYDKIVRHMIIPFSLYIIKNRFSFDTREFNYEDALLMLELFMSSPAGINMTRSILTLDDFSLKEHVFILKHLLSRIKKRLEKNSFFLRIGIDKCFLISSEDEKNDIIEIIDEINSVEKIFSITPVDIGTGINRNLLTSLFV